MIVDMKFILIIAMFFLLLNCTTNSNSSTDDIYFLPLQDCPFNISSIDSGTQIRIIAFSGGEESNEEITYYPQFIGVTKTSDTIRVFTPLISTQVGNIYSSPLLYNYDKGIDVATIQPKSSSLSTAINLFAHSKEFENSNIKNAEDYERISKKTTDEKLVMVRGISIFENPRYKTVIGALHFDEVPW